MNVILFATVVTVLVESHTLPLSQCIQTELDPLNCLQRGVIDIDQRSMTENAS
jgi:hypothetical protein